MRLDNCELRAQFTDRLIDRLTRAEAESMVRAGTARKSGARRYTLIEPVPPSNSETDPCSLKPRDMSIVAGLAKPTLEEYERLTGWGFLVPKPKQFTVGKRLLSLA